MRSLSVRLGSSLSLESARNQVQTTRRNCRDFGQGDTLVDEQLRNAEAVCGDGGRHVSEKKQKKKTQWQVICSSEITAAANEAKLRCVI